MARSFFSRAAAVSLLFAFGCGEVETGREVSPGSRALGDDSLKIATWNMEWLHRDNNAGYEPRDDADYAKIADYVDLLDADIIALQEVDGAEAAARVFDPAVYDFHMSSRNSLQRTGFAYRKGLDVTPRADVTALDVGGLRYGTDLQVDVGDQTLRLLSVHLKSGCFYQSLDSSKYACTKLAQQVGPLEDWIDARVSEGSGAVVLGDFNRRFFASNSDDMWTALDDGSPAGADLSSPTEVGSALCNNGKYPDFIDHLVTSASVTEAVVPDSFEQLLYDASDSGYALPDHCALALELELSGGGGEPPATCEGSCGGQAPSGCWCDDACEDFGNCCADKVEVCDAPEPDPNSCEGSCGGKAPGGCWCDDACENFGNCCVDKVDVCDEPEPPEPPEPDPNSCEGSCNQQAPGGCWCDAACEGYGDCCVDKVAACG